MLGRRRRTSARAVSSSWSPSTVATAVATVAGSTPRWRSSADSARRARPRPACRDSTQAAANAVSSTNPTSLRRSRTAAATSGATPRRCRAAASCARVRGWVVSRRRQMVRAAASGSAGWPASAWRRPGATSEVHRRGRHGVSFGVQHGADPELFLDPLLDLVSEVRVVAHERAGVLLALAQLVALVGVPGAGLAHDALLHAHVDQGAFPADALPVDDVELRLLERRRHLVLHDLDPGPVADRLGAVLEGLDPPHVEPDGCVELQRPTAGRGLRRTEHDADLLPQLVDKDRRRAGAAQRPAQLAQGLAHQPRLQPDMAVAHLALDLRARHEGEMGDSHVGLQARLMSQALRKLSGALSSSGTTAIFINQLREKIGVMFGSPETTTGGRALKFYASIRLDVRRIETLKDGTEAVGNRTRVKVVKNKVAPPFKQAEFDIVYGQGISREGSLIDMGVEQGLVRKSGAWYTYEGDQLGQGKENARAFMRDNPDLANEVEKRIKEKLGIGAVLDAEADTVAAPPVDF